MIVLPGYSCNPYVRMKDVRQIQQDVCGVL